MKQYSQIEIRKRLEQSGVELSADRKGEGLECLVAELFEEIGGVEIAGRNVFNKARSMEIDIALKIDTRISELYFLEHLVIVECKHTQKPTDSRDVSWFANKIRCAGLRIGILFAMGGISGTDRRYAYDQIIMARQTSGVSILVVNKEELLSLENSAQLAAMLEKKLTALRIYDKVLIA